MPETPGQAHQPNVTISGPAAPHDPDDDLLLDDIPAGRVEVTAGTPAATPAPKTEEPPAAPAAVHDPFIADLAVRYGLHADEIKAMSPAELSKAVAFMDRARRQRAPQRQAANHQEPPPAPKAPDIDWGVDEEGKPLAEKNYQPAVAKAIKAAHEIEQIKAENRALQQEIARQSQTQHLQRVNSEIYAALREYPELFGSAGSLDEVDIDSDEGARVQSVYDNLARLKPELQTNPKADAHKIVARLHPGAQRKGRKARADDEPRPPAGIEPARWNAGSLARPNSNTTPGYTNRRDFMLAQEEARRNGEKPVTTLVDYDDDLLP